MTLSDSRWHAIADSNFAWEREALEWLRANLPDYGPWHVWTNFEFIDDEGKVSEVDALVLSPAGLFLVEIKSRPGVLTGDVHSWTWTTDGRSTTVDNPVYIEKGSVFAARVTEAEVRGQSPVARRGGSPAKASVPSSPRARGACRPAEPDKNLPKTS